MKQILKNDDSNNGTCLAKMSESFFFNLFYFSHMRYDTLAQMLTLGNIRAGNKMIVMETCAGLVLGAMMERMGGKFQHFQVHDFFFL